MLLRDLPYYSQYDQYDCCSYKLRNVKLTYLNINAFCAERSEFSSRNTVHAQQWYVLHEFSCCTIEGWHHARIFWFIIWIDRCSMNLIELLLSKAVLQQW